MGINKSRCRQKNIVVRKRKVLWFEFYLPSPTTAPAVAAPNQAHENFHIFFSQISLIPLTPTALDIKVGKKRKKEWKFQFQVSTFSRPFSISNLDFLKKIGHTNVIQINWSFKYYININQTISQFCMPLSVLSVEPTSMHSETGWNQWEVKEKQNWGLYSSQSKNTNQQADTWTGIFFLIFISFCQKFVKQVRKK